MGEEAQKFRGIDIILILTVSLAFFTQNALQTINGPLYPPMAGRKGVTPATYGLVFGTFNVTLLVFGIICGIHIERIGLKLTFVVGVFLNAVTSILFGLTTYVDSYDWFLALSFILLALEGVGAISLLVAGFTIVQGLFKTRVAECFGLLQFGFVFGSALGPIIASILNTQFGFFGSYALFGSFQVAFAVASILVIPNSISASDVTVPYSTKATLNAYWEMMKVPSIFLYLFAGAVAGSAGSFLTAILEPDLEQFRLSGVGVGLMFSIPSVVQVGLPFLGFITGKLKRPEWLLVIGAGVMVVGLVFLGPFPGITPTLGLTALGLLLFGIAQATLMLASVFNLRLEIMRQGFEETVLSNSFVSMASLSASAIGAIITSAAGGILFQAFGFQVTAAVFSSLFLILGLAVTFQIFYGSSRKSETDPLLPRTSGN